MVGSGNGYFLLSCPLSRFYVAFNPAGLPFPNLRLMEADDIGFGHHHDSGGLNGLLISFEMAKNHGTITRADISNGNRFSRLRIPWRPGARGEA